MSEPTTWGRVDADGTVYVREASGERVVGSFQAGTPDEALAYYGRKYEALLLEVDLFERRCRLPEVGVDEVATVLQRLRDSLTEPSAVGDLDTLRGRVEALAPVVDERRAEARVAREAVRNEARALRERIVTDAEALAGSTQWKATGDRLHALLEEWKAAPHVDRTTEQALWKRFGAARNAFDRRRRHHFAQLGAQRAEAKIVKQRILAEAEQLASSTDWAPTAARLRVLMTEWKDAGTLGRADEDSLWRRFRAAQDSFYEARSAAFAERDAGQSTNLAAKEAILAEAEGLLPVTDVAAAKSALRRLQERWEGSGHVPRADRERVEGRMRRVEEAVRKADETRWRRTNPEGLARAQGAVDQLQAAIAKLESERAGARARGDDSAADAADAAIAARRQWLEGAESALLEFSGD